MSHFTAIPLDQQTVCVPESQPQTACSLMANYTRKWTHGGNVRHINQEKGKKEKQSRELVFLKNPFAY